MKEMKREESRNININERKMKKRNGEKYNIEENS